MVASKTSILSSKVHNGEPVKLAFHYNTQTITKFINSLFVKVLSQNDLIYLQGMIETIIREMVINAVKANSKRVYFKKMNLDINNAFQYEQGMENFKAYLIGNMDKMPDELKEGGYKVELFLKKNEDGFKIVVKNNASLLPSEEERINFRINKAREYTDFTEIYMDISDDQEGEGLGIPLTILFLRNSGLDYNSFRIKSGTNFTESMLDIPLKIRPSEVTSIIQQQIVNDVKELPTFPEHIIELQKMCRDRDITISRIAEKISLDPSVSASVIKLANSAGFITSRHIDTIADAVKIIGLKNLNALLVATATRQIMDDRFSSFKDVWHHCNTAAFYARHIALEKGLKDTAEKAFLASLLHDLGKIVLLSANSELTEHIEEVTVKRQMRTSTVLEEITMGISHSSIGKMISQKWNFPEYIAEAIEFHHCPLNAGPACRDVVYVTYVANVMCLLEERKFDYMYMEDEVLNYLGIKDENEFNRLHEKLKKAYLDQAVL